MGFHLLERQLLILLERRNQTAAALTRSRRRCSHDRTRMNPSKIITSPVATNNSLRPDIRMFTVVFSIRASLIWEATVRFQISSYSFFSLAVPATAF
jgi:hypothetical protein